MPRRIEPSRAALVDFDAIYDYIARDNPRAAAQVLRSLDRSIQLLADQPRCRSNVDAVRNQAIS
jgi:plasmid stabilization system protein ParE